MIENKKDAFEEFEAYEDFSDLKTDQLVKEIWLKPKKVFAYLKKHDSDKYVQLLFWVAAFVSVFNRALEKNSISFDSYGIGYLIGGLIAGGVITYLLYYVMAWFLKFFGNAFLKGNATSYDYRLVIAWGNIPTILTIITSFLLIVLYGTNAMAYEPEGYTDSVIFIVLGLIDVGLGIWSIVIIIAGIMEIQKFGVWKAIANLFLPFIILIMMFVIIFGLGDLIGT